MKRLIIKINEKKVKDKSTKKKKHYKCAYILIRDFKKGEKKAELN